ncbi:hypothetical protein NM208_g4122 [Fusarium decemcellulare]|uniref:Uncharacterized protein n=1 Tax=Fusarium decemcellulare TaxID=57161 RepID=A0ACC1SLW3_9HYPO|nr:hypothetical protein NM208_g4122 [Fusarium decemcellulare]
MDPSMTIQFRNTQLYRDVEEGLQNLLMKKISTFAPSLPSRSSRYYIRGLRERKPGGCWCTSDNSRACQPYETCRRRPRHVLGRDIDFLPCNRPHHYNRDCSDRICFDPNDLASDYLDGLLSNRAMRRSFWNENLRDRVNCHLGDYWLSGRQFDAFANIIYLLIEDLQDPFLAADGVWEPEVHGVLRWYGERLQDCIDELMYEVNMVKMERLMNDI